jgi:hypothetical protein
MGAKLSKQSGKHRHVSKNTLTRNRLKEGMPHTVALNRSIAYQLSKNAAKKA